MATGAAWWTAVALRGYTAAMSALHHIPVTAVNNFFIDACL